MTIRPARALSLALGLLALLSSSAGECSGVWQRFALPGAEVRSLVTDPANGTFYAGTAQGSLYRSTDGGQTWRLRRGGTPFPGYAVTAIVPDPIQRGSVWVGLTGIVRGGLLVRTDDGGETFQMIRRFEDRPGARSVSVFHLNGRRILAIGGGRLIEVSEDGGSTWRQTAPMLEPGATISFVAFHPGQPGVLISGSSRHPFRSTDLGKTWQRIAGGMVEDTEVFSVDFSVAAPEDMWASTCGWVYHSTDGGRLWTRFRDGLLDRRAHVVRRDPKDPNRVLVGTTGGLFESRDLGRTFVRLVPEVVVNAIVFDPRTPQNVLIATEADGILRSTDGGSTFRDSSAGLSEARVSAVVRTPRGRIVLARAADGKSGGLWELNSETGVASRIPSQTPASVVALAAKGDRLYAGTPDGLFVSSGEGAPFTLVLPYAVRGLVTTSAGLVVAATASGVFSSRDGAGFSRMGTLTQRVDSIQEAYLLESNQLSLAAEAGGYVQIWDGVDWRIKGNIVKGDQKLAGGFGKRPASVLVPRFLPVGLSVDQGNGFLVFRPRQNPPDAVFLAPPEGGLSISGWSGDPASREGLFVSTIGRGLFRYLPPSPARLEAAP